jgi:tetratricopeptide (TPR) repeat protein
VENPLHEAHEQIERLEEGPESRLKAVITVMILVVTMLTTVAGVLAAIWSARQSETQRERQEAATESLKAGVTAAAQQQSTDALIDDATEADWRRMFLHVYSVEITDQSVSAQLQAQADQAAAVEANINKQLPANARSQSYSDQLQEDALNKSQVAAAYAQESAGWLEKHNGALAVVSMLALSLFLLGLALTLGNRPTQVGFTALAIAMTLIAGARLIQVQATSIAAPTEECISLDGKAVAAVNSAEYDKGREALDEAVAKCPTYDAGWRDLGSTLFYQGVVEGGATAKTLWVKAEDAYQKAVEVADGKTGELYNYLGFMQILNHHFDAAAANLTEAHDLSPESRVIMGSLAELAIAQGDETKAFAYLKKAALSLQNDGPYLRDNYFFTSLRYDRAYFATAGITGAKVDQFFLRTREAEALLDSKDMTSPYDTHGARISGLIFKKSDTELGRSANFVTIGFTYHDLKVGDVISLRFYGYRDSTFDPTASLTETVQQGSSLVGSGVENPDTDFRLGLTYQGETTMEVYLNGVSQGEVSLTI